MRTTHNKTRKSRTALILKSGEPKKIIPEEEIRKRAYEVFKEDDNSSSNELDNWYYAERELNGYYL